MHLLLKNIEWDSEGMRPVEDCLLPLNVLAINVPTSEMEGDELHAYLGELLTETYGFQLYDFKTHPINLDGVRVEGGFRQTMPWPELAQAVMDGDNQTALYNARRNRR